MVGGAVKAGSGNRGGRFYQLMALFLTYSAIVAMLVPGVSRLSRRKRGRITRKLRRSSGKPAPRQRPS